MKYSITNVRKHVLGGVAAVVIVGLVAVVLSTMVNAPM
jgi:hypothetical protein